MTLTERIAVHAAGAEARGPQPPDVARWRAATVADVDAIHDVAAAADAVDHPTWIIPREEIADVFTLPHIDAARDTMLAVDAEGSVIAYAVSALHPAREGTLSVHLDGAVHPQWRRRGIGGAIIAWGRMRGLAQLAEAASTVDPRPDGSDWVANLKIYAEESNADHRAVAEREGYAPLRWFTTMERDMSAPVSVPPAPDGIRVVPYTHDRDDDARLARNDAFRDHWGSLPSQPASWATFVGGSFFRPDLSRLAVDDEGTIVGFCLASVNEDDWAALGASHAYIDLIGVVRAQRRRGIAPLVIASTLAAISAEKLERAVLDVDTASPTGANALYEGLGFAATERSIAFVTEI